MSQALHWAVSILIAGCIMFVPVFLYYLLTVPARMEQEQQNKINRLQLQLDDLQNQLKSTAPIIAVTVINETGKREMFLEVANTGQRGDFEAQIEMLEGAECIHGMVTPPLPTYRGYWQLNAGSSANLLQGQKDRLVIGRVGYREGFFSFSMCFYDAVNRQRAEYGTISWPLWHPKESLPRFVLRVTISSEPKQLGGPLVKTYIVDGGARDHLREGEEA